MKLGSRGQDRGSPTGTQVPDPQARRLLAAQTRQLFSQSWIGAIGAAMGAVVLIVALWSVVSHVRLLVWSATYLTLFCGRILFLRAFLARQRADEQALNWLPWLHFQTTVGGLFWGLAGVFLFPETSTIHQFVLMVCIAGVSSAGVATFSPTMGFLSCLAAQLVPSAVRFLWNGRDTDIAMAVVITLYGVVLALIGRRMHDVNARSLELGFANADLVVSLGAKKLRVEGLNQELKAEIEVRKQKDEALQKMQSELEARVEQRSSQLRTSQEKMVALFKGIPVPSYIWQVHNGDFMLVNYNDAAEKMSQGRVSQLLGVGARDVFQDRPDVLDDLHRALHTRAPVEREMPSGMYADERRYLTVTYVFVPPDLILVHAEDITARKEAERALKQSEGEFRALVEGSFDGIFIQTGGRIIFSNYRLQEMLGYRAGELDQLDMWELYHPDDRKVVRDREINRLRGKEVPSKYEVRLLRKDGSCFPAELDARLGLFRGGPGIQVCVRDISERALAERERLRLVTAIEQSAETVMITDTYMGILYVNRAFESTTGYNRDEALGEHYRTFMGEQEDSDSYREMLSTLAEGKAWSGRLTSRRKDRGLYTEEATISPIRDPSGEVINYVCVKRDVTHETALENQVRQAQKMQAIGTLAGGIAHDFNNVLYAIIGFSELALADAPPGSQLHTYLSGVISAGERAHHLVKQILTFCRQSETEKNPMEISSVVKEALKFLRASLPSTIEIRKHIDPSAGDIIGDPTQIHQVLMNLCTNAAQAMRDTGGILAVGLDSVEMDSRFVARHPELKPGLYTRVTISDTGTGMTPEVLERIFEPYFTTKKKGEGTGLGLAVVHGIVKDHEGAITVQSEPGIGTTVQVCFPGIGKAAAHDAPAIEAPPLGSERILLVDDEPSVIQMSSETLERLGYHVTTVSSGTEALEVFRADPGQVDLVISDMTMPKMTGKALAQELMAIRPDIPIILCTGFSELISEKEAESLGIRALVMKPIHRSRIAETVRRVLDRQP